MRIRTQHTFSRRQISASCFNRRQQRQVLVAYYFSIVPKFFASQSSQFFGGVSQHGMQILEAGDVNNTDHLSSPQSNMVACSHIKSMIQYLSLPTSSSGPSQISKKASVMLQAGNLSLSNSSDIYSYIEPLKAHHFQHPQLGLAQPILLDQPLDSLEFPTKGPNIQFGINFDQYPIISNESIPLVSYNLDLDNSSASKGMEMPRKGKPSQYIHNSF